LEEAIALFQTARELDPLAVTQHTTGLAQLYAIQGRDAEAIAEWEKDLELEPNYYAPHQGLGNFYCQRGESEKGAAYLERAIELSPEDPIVAGDLGYCYAISGRADDARKLLREIQALSRTQYVDFTSLAIVHLGLGQYDETLRWLEEAYDAGALLLGGIGLDPRYDRLRSDPRFQSLLRRIGLGTESS
jgi:tetratricopeptide (TPR) repeat protein